jgi:hypothetical protein
MKHQQMMAFMLVAVALVVYAVYVQGSRMIESFEGKVKWMFIPSPHTPPVVCLAGNKHIPCTAFTTA